MKKILLGILFVFCMAANAQNDVETLNRKVSSYFTINEDIVYFLSSVEGDVKDQDMYASVFDYVKEKKTGDYFTRYKNEDLAIVLPFWRGELDGVARVFSKFGFPKEETTYRKGLKDGVSKTYHSNGQLKTEKTYTDGKEVDSNSLSFFDNGQIEETKTYKNGRLDGKWIRYRADGTIELYYNYRNGEKHGEQNDYDRNGKLISTEYYEYGVRKTK